VSVYIDVEAEHGGPGGASWIGTQRDCYADTGSRGNNTLDNTY